MYNLVVELHYATRVVGAYQKPHVQVIILIVNVDKCITIP